MKMVIGTFLALATSAQVYANEITKVKCHFFGKVVTGVPEEIGFVRVTPEEGSASAPRNHLFRVVNNPKFCVDILNPKSCTRFKITEKRDEATITIGKDYGLIWLVSSIADIEKKIAGKLETPFYNYLVENNIGFTQDDEPEDFWFIREFSPSREFSPKIDTRYNGLCTVERDYS